MNEERGNARVVWYYEEEVLVKRMVMMVRLSSSIAMPLRSLPLGIAIPFIAIHMKTETPCS